MSSLLDRLRAKLKRKASNPQASTDPARRLALFAALGTAIITRTQAQVNPPSWQTGYIYVTGGVTVTTNIPNPTPYNLTNLNIIAAGNITTWNVALPSQPFDGQVISISQGLATVTTLNLTAPGGFAVTNSGFGAYQFQVYQNAWIFISSFISNGGGGVNGLISVNSLTALAALPPATGIAYLNALGRSGSFAWIAGNQTAAVAADLNQAIAVAWSGDTSPGATGAWVRQYSGPVNLAWWGLLSDSTFASAPAIAANSTALADYGTWARYNSTTLGGSADTNIPDGSYPFDNFLCQRWYSGIARLHWIGHGAIFQNVTTNSSWKLPWEFASLPIDQGGAYQSAIINATVVGATSFTVTTPTNITNILLLVGQLVGLGSLDTAFFGFPPNIYNWEILRITAINTSTGVVTVDRPIQFAHLTTFPDGINNPQAGAARVWQLNTTNTINGVTAVTTFDVTHVMEITVLPNLNAPVGGQNMTGRSITWLNAKPASLVPSIADEVNIIRCQVAGVNEPDKLVGSFNIDQTEILGDLPFQSNSFGRVNISRSKITGTLTTGGKVVNVTSCEIETLFPGGASFGTSEGTVIDGSLVRQYTARGFASGKTNGPVFTTVTATAAASWSSGATTITLASNPGGIVAGNVAFDTTTGLPIAVVLSVSGITVTFKAAAINASSGASDGLLFGSAIYWKGVIIQAYTGNALVALQPGNALMLAGTSGAFTGDFGTMFIQGITGDGTFFYAQTTYQATTLPSWAPGPSYVQKSQLLTVRSSTGCDGIRRAREATSAGVQEGQFIRDTFLGVPSTGGLWKAYGIPTSMAVTVSQVSALTTPTFRIFGFLNTANNPAASTIEIIWTIDLTTLGARSVTGAAASLVALGSDTLTYNGSAVTSIPANVIWSGNATSWQFSPAPSGGSQEQMPIVEVEMKFDTGMFFRGAITQYDMSGLFTTFESNLTGAPI